MPRSLAPISIGSGPDDLVLLMAEDAYGGDAQFTVSIDGVQVGGVQTVVASAGAGETQAFNVLGAFGASQHVVTVDFLNDAYDGSASTDRNLYVVGASIGGVGVSGAALSETSSGPQSFVFANAAAAAGGAPGVVLGAGPDTLSLFVAEDAYAGDAQFTISVDGVQVGGVQTATASESGGGSQRFDVLGAFGAGQHTVTVDFLNDAYGGSAATDRNLYVTGASINGQAVAGAALNEYWAGPQSFGFSGTGVGQVEGGGPALFVAAGGSDSGDGSAAHPFATIQHALAQMQAGGVSTLYLESGTYGVSSPLVLGSGQSGFALLAAPGAAPVLDAAGGNGTILSLSGARNVTVSGLTFRGASADPQGAALVLNGASGNAITGNSFVGNAEAALFVNASGNTFSGNTVLDTGGSAVEVKDGSGSNLFTDNVINGVSAPNLSGGGFYVHGGSYNTISNNLIENTAGAGINIQDFGYGTTTNVGNVITRNQILNTSTSPFSTDDGAIYILGRSDTDLATTVSMNFISGAGNVNPFAHVEGIYLDDNASGVTVTSNIVRGVQSDATELHGGYKDVFSNNIFDLGTGTRTAALIQQPEPDRPATVAPALSDDAYTNNIIVSQQANPAYAFVYFDPDTVHLLIQNNLYYDALVPAGGVAGGFYFAPNSPAGSLPTVFPVNDTNPVVGDPGFVPGVLGSYVPGAGSAAGLIGFVPIDTSLIGPR